MDKYIADVRNNNKNKNKKHEQIGSEDKARSSI